MTSCNPCCNQNKIINPSVDPSNWNFCNFIAYSATSESYLKSMHIAQYNQYIMNRNNCNTNNCPYPNSCTFTSHEDYLRYKRAMSPNSLYTGERIINS